MEMTTNSDQTMIDQFGPGIGSIEVEGAVNTSLTYMIFDEFDGWVSIMVANQYPFGPSILPSLPILDIIAGVETNLSKLIFPFSISLIRDSKLLNSAPESFASLDLVSSHKTATFTFFPFPCGRFALVLRETSSFFCFKFKFKDISIYSATLAVQLLFIFLTAFSIVSIFLSFDKSNNFPYLFENFFFIIL